VNSYASLHAAHYDRIYADKPYADEARFVHELVGRPAGHRLLDVACGTGRHALAFAELGYTVTGADLNPDLLSIARQAAESGVRFVQGDMRDLQVDGGPFDVVTCLFDSIGYAQDNDGIVATLRSLGRHLSPSGTLVCEFLHAPALVCLLSPTRVGRWALDDGGRLMRTAETTIDIERMVMRVHYELLLFDAAGGVEQHEEVHLNRLLSAPEMRLLAEVAGLTPDAIVPAYRQGAIGAGTFHLLLLASPAA
jgi:ubiquinone/menaquinone biosynthesis C-methylase UbiE